VFCRPATSRSGKELYRSWALLVLLVFHPPLRPWRSLDSRRSCASATARGINGNPPSPPMATGTSMFSIRSMEPFRIVRRVRPRASPAGQR